MAKFFTKEWCEAYKDAINNSAAYEEAGKTWEGDFYFVMEPSGPVKEKGYMYVDLWHGKCRGCEIVTDPDKFKPAFILSAPYAIWKQIATKKLDSTKALITKQSKLTGDMAKVMRYTKAANELTNATMTIQTEWLD